MKIPDETSVFEIPIYFIGIYIFFMVFIAVFDIFIISITEFGTKNIFLFIIDLFVTFVKRQLVLFYLLKDK